MRRYFKLAPIVGLFLIAIILILKAVFMKPETSYSGNVDYNYPTMAIFLMLAGFALMGAFALINDIKDAWFD